MKDRLCLTVVTVALLAPGWVLGQNLMAPPGGGLGPTTLPVGSGAGAIPPPPTLPENGAAGTTPGQGDANPAAAPRGFDPMLNEYLTYGRPCNCCGPVGRDGPITYELYTRHGVSFPLGSNLFGNMLTPGYMMQAGGRSLFFQPSNTFAWTVDIGITTRWFDVGDEQQILQRNIPQNITIFGQTQTIIVPEKLVTPSSLNQTFVHLAFGNEWYFDGPATCCTDCPTTGCRVGWDLGIRYGSAKVVYNEIIHGTDVIGGILFALHADFECPYKCCIFQAGVRTEICQMWSDILQPQHDADLTTLNILFNAGIRF